MALNLIFMGSPNFAVPILKALQDHMKQETGGEVIKNVIFTKYLYQGG